MGERTRELCNLIQAKFWLDWKRTRDRAHYFMAKRDYPNGKPAPIAIADHIERATGESD